VESGLLDPRDAWVHVGTMHRLNVALLVLTIALLPLLFISLWFGIAVAVAAYVLVARLAGNDLDRLSRRRKQSSHSLEVKSRIQPKHHQTREH
jgi:Flp pilus assembly protein TadB